jgi:hypothetical protein
VGLGGDRVATREAGDRGTRQRIWSNQREERLFARPRADTVRGDTISLSEGEDLVIAVVLARCGKKRVAQTGRAGVKATRCSGDLKVAGDLVGTAGSPWPAFHGRSRWRRHSSA